jgi:hypothetical protein
MQTFMVYLRTFFLCFGMLHLSMLPGYVLAQQNETNGKVTMPAMVEQAEAASVEQQQKEYEQDSESNKSSGDQSSKAMASRVDSRQGEGADSDTIQSLMDLVTMIGVGLLAKSLILYTPVTTDMMIAAAGGAAYLYGEISALDATKEKMESETFELTRYEDGSTNNLQREALERQKKSYEDLAEMMDTKASLKKTAAAAFAAAAIVAVISGAQVDAASASCISTTSTYAATCAPPYNMTPCPCVAGAASIASSEAAAQAESNTPGANSLQKKATIEAYNITTTSSATTSCSAVSSPCTALGSLRKMFISAGNMGMAQGFIISGAGALLMKKMGLGPLAGLVSAAFINLYGFHDTIMASPYLRASSYGVLAGLAFTGASTSEEQANIMRENAQTIQKMLNEMYNLQNASVASLSGNEQQLQVANGLKPIEGFERGISSQELICGPDAKERIKDGENCDSQQKRISENVEVEQKAGLGSLPGAVLGAAGQVGHVADSLRDTGGLTDGAFADAQKLSSNADALRRLNSRVRDQVNATREKRGEKPFDFEGHERRIAGKFKEAIIKALNDNPEKASGTMAALRNKLPESLNKSDKEKESVASQNVEGPKSESVEDSQAFAIPEFEPEDFSLDLDDTDPQNARASVGANGETIVDVNENLDTDGNDIVSNKEVSIFKVISVRYMKSGIPRLIDLE